MMAPTGSAATVRIASSPSRIIEISPRVNPSTRRLASSRARSDSDTRAELYTTPNAMIAANTTLKKICRFIVAAIVSRKF